MDEDARPLFPVYQSLKAVADQPLPRLHLPRRGEIAEFPKVPPRKRLLPLSRGEDLNRSRPLQDSRAHPYTVAIVTCG